MYILTEALIGLCNAFYRLFLAVSASKEPAFDWRHACEAHKKHSLTLLLHTERDEVHDEGEDGLEMQDGLSESTNGLADVAAGQEKQALSAPSPLLPHLITMSMLPKTQWQNLIHLDAIKVFLWYSLKGSFLQCQILFQSLPPSLVHRTKNTVFLSPCFTSLPLGRSALPGSLIFKPLVCWFEVFLPETPPAAEPYLKLLSCRSGVSLCSRPRSRKLPLSSCQQSPHSAATLSLMLRLQVRKSMGSCLDGATRNKVQSELHDQFHHWSSQQPVIGILMSRALDRFWELLPASMELSSAPLSHCNQSELAQELHSLKQRRGRKPSGRLTPESCKMKAQTAMSVPSCWPWGKGISLETSVTSSSCFAACQL